MASGSLSPLADHDRAAMGPRPLSQNRLPGSLLLLGAEAEEDGFLARRDRSGDPQNLREVEVLEGVVRPERQRKIAVDAVFDSVSVATTFQKELKAAGVIFMPISEAIREHPELVRKYLGTVVPTSDNYFE